MPNLFPSESCEKLRQKVQMMIIVYEISTRNTTQLTKVIIQLWSEFQAAKINKNLNSEQSSVRYWNGITIEYHIEDA